LTIDAKGKGAMMLPSPEHSGQVAFLPPTMSTLRRERNVGPA
jgi:hypothetical protein